MPPPFGPILISKEPKESVFKGEGRARRRWIRGDAAAAAGQHIHFPPKPTAPDRSPAAHLQPASDPIGPRRAPPTPPTPARRPLPRRLPAAVLVLQRVGNLALTEDAQALEVFISGDSALGIYALLNGQATERPMALDVLWQVRAPQPAARGWV